MNALQRIAVELEIRKEKERIKHSKLIKKAYKYGINLSNSYRDFEFALDKGLLSPKLFS